MPAEFGGQDLPPVLCSAIYEMFTAANKAFSMCPNLVPEAIRALMAADKVDSSDVYAVLSKAHRTSDSAC